MAASCFRTFPVRSNTTFSPCQPSTSSRPHPHVLRSFASGSGHGRRGFAQRANPVAVAESSNSTGEQSRGQALLDWLHSNGIPPQKVELAEVEREGRPLDVTVASEDLQPGDVALRIPEELVITLRRVFEDGTVAELLTTGKLSELACLTLYLMYEKKMGRESMWYEFIKELDRIQARGQMGAKTPLLWEAGEVDELLAGSPLASDVRERLKGMEKEYQELDTVWFMAGSLFRNYPYDIPTEAFSFSIFKQAFAAVQASVVHLQGVPLCKRFALVPLGPPLLSYSSTSKALLRYDPATEEVQLAVDREYRRGDPIYAWCGPQPNRRLLLNYGIVDEDSPYDNLSVIATLPSGDPLFSAKRTVLQGLGLATQQTFQLLRNQKLPPLLLPFMRVAYCQDAGVLREDGIQARLQGGALDAEEEAAVRDQLQTYLEERLGRYPRSIEQDEATINSSTSTPREKVAARLVRIEKQILRGSLADLRSLPPLEGGSPASSRAAVRLT